MSPEAPDAERERVEATVRIVLRALEEYGRPKEKKTGLTALLDSLDKRWSLVVAGLTVLTAILARLIFGVSLMQPLEELAAKQAANRREQQKTEFDGWARDFHLKLGNKFLDVGQFQAAMSEFNDAIAADATSVDAARGKFKTAIFMSLGETHGDREVLQVQTEQLLAEHPDDAHANYLRGWVLENSKPEEALTFLGKALERDPNLSMAHVDMGFLYDSLGQHDRSVEEYRQAIAISPWSAPARNNLGYELYQLGRHDEALAVYDGLLGLVPTIGPPRIVIAYIDWAKGDFEGARASSSSLISVLDNKELCDGSWNSTNWFVNMDRETVYLTSLPAKRRYARYQLALSLFALGRSKEGADVIASSTHCEPEEEANVTRLARFDARSVESKQPAVVPRLEDYLGALDKAAAATVPHGRTAAPAIGMRD